MHPPSTSEPTHLSGEVFIASVGSLLLHSLPAVCLLNFFIMFVPLVESLARDHQLALATPAQVMFFLSQRAVRYWFVLIPLAVLVDVVIVVLLVRLRPGLRWLLTGYNYLLLVGTLMFITWGTLMAVAPLQALRMGP
jgi:hypothetical protein